MSGWPKHGDCWSPDEANRLDAVERACEPWREARARHHFRVALAPGARESLARWHAARGGRLRHGWRELARVCRAPGGGRVRATCRDCHGETWVPARCGQARWWCRRCSYRRGKRLERRIREGIAGALARERRRWRERGGSPSDAPRVTLLTLTLDHEGTLSERRRVLVRAWARLRAWMRAVLGYAPPYWATWEITEGSDGRGHPHLHVVLLLGWLDYASLHREWRRATDGRGRMVDVQRRRGRATDGHAAARYVAKYVTKSGEIALSLPVELAAQWIGATYGQRLVHVGVGCWQPEPAAECYCDWCGTDRLDWSYDPAPASDGEPGGRAPPPWVRPADKWDLRSALDVARELCHGGPRGLEHAGTTRE